MTTVFTGNALGFFDSSLAALGGTLSGAGGRNQQGVNATNGNLVLSAIDETLFSRGMSVFAQRYYNSQAALSDAGADAWRTGLEKELDLSQASTAGDGGYVTLTDADLSVVRFDWNADRQCYVSAAGSGAHDTVRRLTSSVWIREDGSTGRQEWFNVGTSPTKWRLSQVRDSASDGADPVRFAYAYENDRIVEVKYYRTGDNGSDGNNEALVFGYDESGRLSTVSTRERGATTARHQVTYRYDGYGRLEYIEQDLLPDNGVADTWNAAGGTANDGKVFRTQYTYVGSTLRIASVAGSDGHVTSYTYDASGRIATVKQGSLQTQTFTYATGRTDVVDVTGHKWSYHHTGGRLTKIEGPARDGVRDVTTYTYDTALDPQTGVASFDLLRMETTRGGVLVSATDYRYDANGNLLWECDAAGNAVQRSYTTTHRLAWVKRFTGLDPDGIDGATLPTGVLLERCFYNATNQLRFTIDEAGMVTETVYDATSLGNATGLPVAIRRYNHAAFSGTYTTTGIETWVSALTDAQRDAQSLTTLKYDAWSRLSEKTEFASVLGGAGVADATALTTRYTYDAQGLLRTEIAMRSGTKTQATDYVYDGIGRLLHTVRWDGGSLYIAQSASVATQNADPTGVPTDADERTGVSSVEFQDSARRVVLTTDAGTTRTEVRDTGGRLVQIIDGATGQSSRNTFHYYDADGQRIATRDATGELTYFFHDERGNLVGTVDATGALTEHEYDAAGRMTRTLQHDGLRSTAGWASGSGLSMTFALPSFAAVRALWTENFNDTSLPGFDTAALTNPAYTSLTHDTTNGRVVLQRTDRPEGTAYPRLTGPVVPVASGPMYRFEVGTGADLGNLYGFFALHNSVNFHAGILFSYGKIYAYATGSSNIELLTLAANTTYVIELHATDAGVEARISTRGQDPSNALRHEFSTEGWAWQQCYLNIQSRMGPGESGGPLYVDNVEHRQVRTTTREYDLGGRLQVERTGLAATTHEYDGAHRLVRSTTSAPGETDRVVRHIYGPEDRLLGTVDAEGFVVEHVYDVAGRLVASTRYANASTNPSGTTIASVRPAADSANDQVTRFFHDGRDRQIASLDAEGYLTTTAYDELNHRSTVRRFKLAQAPGGTATLATLLAQAGTAKQETQQEVDALGRLCREVDAFGTVTLYHYDHAGRLERTEVAQGTTEVAHTERLYDVWGNLVGEMTAANAVDATGARRITDTMDYAARAAVFQTWGDWHGYDVLGRRTQTIDAHDHRTFYYYDSLGRQIYTARGLPDTAGALNRRMEVTRTVYDAFGQISETIAYANVAANTAGTYAGALAVIEGLAYADALVDNRQTYLYDNRGLLVQQSDAEGGLSVFRYNGFGELASTTTASGTTAASTTTRAYDRRGLLTTRTEAAGTTVERTTSQVHDAFGRVTSAIDGRGLTTTLAYDRLGRQLNTERETYVVDGSTTPRIERQSSTYDAYGRVLTSVDGLGVTTTCEYDDTARTLTVTTGEGLETKTAFDRHGRTLTITAPGGGITRYAYDDSGRLLKTTDANGDYVTNEYDKRGLLVATVDANGSGNRVQYTYDAVGRVLTRTEDAGTGRLNLVTTYAYDGLGRQVTVTDANGDVTTTGYDRTGRTLLVTRDPTGLDLQTKYVWDAAGRQVSVTEGFGSAKPRTTDYAYDTLGRRIRETVDPGTGKLNLVTSYAYDGNDNVVARTDAAGNITRYAYDEANRLIYTLAPLSAAGTASPEFAVTRNWYDKAGRLTATRRYAETLTLTAAQVATLSTTSGDGARALLESVVTKDEWKDAVDFRVYDRDGRVRFLLRQAAGDQLSVDEIRYDAAGRAFHRLEYGTWASFTITPRTSLLMQAYNGTAATIDAIESSVATRVASQASTARENYSVYDAAGQERFVVTRSSATQGVVTEKRYDDAGRVVSSIAYLQPIAFNPSATLATVTTQVASLTKRTTTYGFDRLGRTTTITDALNNVERFDYDAVGNRTSYTDKLGRVWNYDYDAAGRLIEELTPALAVWRNGTLSGVGVTYATVRIATRMTYDALGNVLTRTENADAAADQQRTTTYEYDARGLQKRTILPDPWRYDEASGAMVATGVRPDIRVTYDALGRAVTQRNELGVYSYKVYDTLGRITHDVDAAGYVTAYGYDALDRQTSLTRYANPLDKTALQALGWTNGTAISKARIETAGVVDADAANDRTLTTAYDQLGRKVQVWQSAILHWASNGSSATVQPTTKFQYDGFDQLVLESTLIDDGTNAAPRWADTWHYYDVRGQRTMTVDAEGYVTSFAYDAAGAEVARVEFARAIDTVGLVAGGTPPALPAAGDLSTGYDRSVVTVYDALGRKISETRPRLFQTPTGHSGVRQVVTAYEYDDEDRVTAVIDDGARTTTTYDALGRAISVTEPERQVLRADWLTLLQDAAIDLTDAALYDAASPYSVMRYDAFGQAVMTVKYANGRVDGSVVTDSANDQSTYTRYDLHGRAVITRDAAIGYAYSAYDAAGRVARTWREVADGTGGTSDIVTDYTHDALDRQTSAITTRTKDGVAATDAREAARYNAFGEIVARGATLTDLADPAKAIEFEYDRAGNQIEDDAEGSVRQFGYNLAGQQVREARYWLDSESSPAAVTRITRDLLGREIGRLQPSHTGSLTNASTISLKLDRWGNVLEQVDPRGAVTTWTYNDRDQAIRQLAPEVQVVSATGVTTWDRPETRWMYDAAGRLVAVRDPNGNTDRTTYDVAGHALTSIDALGNVTRHAYDALGRQRVRQDASGYLSTQSYDRVDRLTGTGDFLVAGAGATRVYDDRETYVLNTRGDRLRTTNALGQYARQDFDSRGLLIRTLTATGLETTYAYDVYGNRIKETNGLGAYQSWTYDVHGRVKTHRDLGGNDYVYTYGKNGRLATETSTDLGLARTFTYYPNGAVRRIQLTTSDYSEYEYDAAGNRTLERTVNTAAGLNTVTRIVYDSHGRIARVTTDDLLRPSGQQRTLDLEYAYDAVGNRRRVVANSGYGPGVDPLSTANQAPAKSNPANVTLKVGQPVEWRIRPGDHFSDPDGDAMTYAVVGTLPTWLTFSQDAVTKEWIFAYTGAGAAGTHANVTIRANGGGVTSDVVFNAAIVTNTTPILRTAGVLLVEHKSTLPVQLDVWATDVFVDSDVGDTLDLGVTTGTLPAGFTADTSVFGRVRLTAAAGLAAGDYTLTLRGVDASGAPRSKTLTVRVKAPAAPTAVGTLPPQSIQPGRDFDLQFDVGSLFTDANGDTFALDASTSTGDQLPSWIDFAVISDGNRRYVRLLGTAPSTMTSGQTVPLLLRAVDADGMVGTRTLTLTTNLPPAVPAGTSLSLIVGKANSQQLTGYSDPSGGTLTYAATGLPAGVSLSTAGLLTGTPTALGDYAVTVTVTSSSSGLVSTKALMVRVINRDPVASTIPNQTALTGQAWSLNVSSYITDVDGQTLTWSVGALPPGVTFSPSTKTFGGTPTTAGTYTITVSASDGYGGVDSTSFTLTVSTAFVPTVVNPIPDRNAFANEAWSYTFASNTFNGTPTGYTHSYSSSPSTGTVVAFNASTRTFSISNTPKVTSGVQFTITVTASYAGGQSVSDTFMLYVDPDERFGGGGMMMMKSGGGELEGSMEGSYAEAEQTDFAMAESGYTAQVQTTTVPNPGENRHESWYLYDAENRVTLVNGTLDGGQIVLSSATSYNPSSYMQQYDEMGRVVLQTFDTAEGLKADRTDYTQRGERWRTYTQYAGDVLVPRTVDTYDAAGRLTRSVTLFGPNAVGQYYTNEGGELLWWNVDLEGAIANVVDYVYDADGRLRTQTTLGRRANTGPSGFNPNSPDYDPRVETAAAWLAAQFPGGGRNLAAKEYTYDPANTTLTKLDEVLYTTEAGTTGVRTDDASAYDAAGRLMSYRYVKSATAWAAGQSYTIENSQTWTHTYTTTYLARDGYLEQKVAATSSNTNYRPSSTTSTYDAAGRRTEIVDWADVPGDGNNLQAKRTLAYNGDGQILLQRRWYYDSGTWKQGKDESSSSNLYNKFRNTISDTDWNGLTDTQRATWYDLDDNTRATYVAGQQVATHTEAGTAFNANGGLTGFSNTRMGRTQVQVQQGDTLKTLAQRTYGTEALWYVLADANGLTAESSLPAGSTLTAPEVKTTSNDASTFKPYDPSEITGPTSPAMAYMPPPDAGCGAAGMVIMIAIMVVLTIFTAGAAAVAMGASGSIMSAGAAALVGGGTLMGTGVAMGAAAIGGFVGSVYGQVAGTMMGVADGVNFKDAAVASFTSFAGSGIGGALRGTSLFTTGKVGLHGVKELTAAGRTIAGVSGYAAGAAGRAIVGQKSDFSWKGVAASAIGSFASAKLGGVVPTLEGGTSTGDFVNDLVGTYVDRAVNASARRLMGLGEQDWDQIAIDAFGNALGNAAVRGLQNWEAVATKAVGSVDNIKGGSLPKKEYSKFDPSGIFGEGGVYSTAGRYGDPLEAISLRGELPLWAQEQAPAPIRLPMGGGRGRAGMPAEQLTQESLAEGKGWGILSAGAGRARSDAAPRATIPISDLDPELANIPSDEVRPAKADDGNASSGLFSTDAYRQTMAAAGVAGTSLELSAKLASDVGIKFSNLNPGAYTPMLIANRGRIPMAVSTPMIGVEVTSTLRNADVVIRGKQFAPWLTGTGRWLGFLGVAAEGTEVALNPDAGAAEYGHLGLNGGVWVYGAAGGPYGLAAAAVWTIIDTPVQLFAKHTIEHGHRSGDKVEGWRAIVAARVDQRENRIRELSLEHGASRERVETVMDMLDREDRMISP